MSSTQSEINGAGPAAQRHIAIGHSCGTAGRRGNARIVTADLVDWSDTDSSITLVALLNPDPFMSAAS
jgi:hypothetical protein